MEKRVRVKLNVRLMEKERVNVKFVQAQERRKTGRTMRHQSRPTRKTLTMTTHQKNKNQSVIYARTRLKEAMKRLTWTMVSTIRKIQSHPNKVST